MLSLNRLLFACAVLVPLFAPLPADAGEVVADPACRKSCGSCRSCYSAPCYDPCEPVGPIRRFWRRVLFPPCPRPTVVMPVPVPAPCPAPIVVQAPPATAYIERPIPTPAPAIAPVPAPGPTPTTGGPLSTPFPSAVPSDVPSSSGMLRREGRLTPPVAEPPIRVDRIASYDGEERLVIRDKATEGKPLLLTHRDMAANSVRTRTDSSGVFRVELPAAGEWYVYDVSGEKSVYRGRLTITTPGVVSRKMAE